MKRKKIIKDERKWKKKKIKHKATEEQKRKTQTKKGKIKRKRREDVNKIGKRKGRKEQMNLWRWLTKMKERRDGDETWQKGKAEGKKWGGKKERKKKRAKWSVGRELKKAEEKLRRSGEMTAPVRERSGCQFTAPRVEIKCRKGRENTERREEERKERPGGRNKGQGDGELARRPMAGLQSNGYTTWGILAYCARVPMISTLNWRKAEHLSLWTEVWHIKRTNAWKKKIQWRKRTRTNGLTM